MIASCSTCIKFRHECPNGVSAPNPDGTLWNGHDGGCSLWMREQCTQCKHNQSRNGRRDCAIDAGWMERTEDRGCASFAPKVAQATLEGF